MKEAILTTGFRSPDRVWRGFILPAVRCIQICVCLSVCLSALYPYALHTDTHTHVHTHTPTHDPNQLAPTLLRRQTTNCSCTRNSLCSRPCCKYLLNVWCNYPQSTNFCGFREAGGESNRCGSCIINIEN